MAEQMKIGDTVSVNFHNAQMVLCRNAEILYKPCQPGDGWMFKCLDTGNIYDITEPCTVTKRPK